MHIETDGLVIREQPVGENDRLVTLLTRKAGIVRGFAKGIKTVRNPKSSGTSLLSYSQFSLYQGRSRMIIDNARPKEMFFGLREDIGRLALAQYFCELAGALAPEGQPAEDCLRLLLNGLYFLSKGQRHPLLLKTAVEMRMLSFAGYIPDFLYCQCCGCYEADTMFFLPDSGTLLCSACGGQKRGIPLNRGMLTALRYTVYADFDKLFSFRLPPQGLAQINRASERYLLHTLQRTFPTLEFYRQVADTEGKSQELFQEKTNIK